MIIFISDLHMSDTTAGPPNIPLAAFTGTFADMECLAKDSGAKELTVVFLGDVFDQIRTTKWQEFDESVRPWGDQSLNPSVPLPDAEAAANKVFDAIIDAEQNRASFKAMRDAFKNIPNLIVHRVYIPGNHDRLCDLYPSLRAKTAEILGLDARDPNTPFDNVFIDLPHACFARHGHEWDAFNFDGDPIAGKGNLLFKKDDFYKTPIGDLLAAEVSSRLPVEVMKRLPEGFNPPHLKDRLQNLFDLRPNSAMVEYLAFQIKQYGDDRVTDAINGAFKELATEFEGMDFVERWMGQHFHVFNLLSPAVEIKALFEALKIVHFQPLAKILSAVGSAAQHFVLDDNFRSKAVDEFQRLDTVRELAGQIQYVLYGHTHDPDQEAISVLGKAGEERDRVYLNTGMWRPIHAKGAVDGFVTWKNLTYSVIYLPTEDKPTRYPNFETWSGTLKEP